jgi:uncharacterized membrane protein YeaQ/YmgE (transglycosylase-associated protein family)
MSLLELLSNYSRTKSEGIVMSIVWFLIIGLIAGWLAGQIMKGRGFGLLGNLIVGVIGALLGGLLFGVLGMSTTNILGSLVTAVIGAVVLLYIVGKVKKV